MNMTLFKITYAYNKVTDDKEEEMKVCLQIVYFMSMLIKIRHNNLVWLHQNLKK